MQRETRIGLLVGLAFIILFGVVLSELGLPAQAPEGRDEAGEDRFYEQAPVIGEVPEMPGRSRRVLLIARPERSARRTAGDTIGTARAGRTPAATRRRRARTDGTAHGAQRHYAEMTLSEFARAHDVRAAGRAQGPRTYVTRSGDTLTGIARRFLNSPSRAAVTKIFSANRDKLSSPDKLSVGIRLVIPN